MQVTKGTWCMREQCVPGSLSSSPAGEPGNEARFNFAKCMLAVRVMKPCVSTYRATNMGMDKVQILSLM